MMPFDALKVLLLGFFVLFALGVFTLTCQANAQSQRNQEKTPLPGSADAKPGLNFSLWESWPRFPLI